MAFVKDNIRDIVFGSSTNQLFSFGEGIQEEEKRSEDVDVFEELKITKYLYTERSGVFCRQKTMYTLLM
jgi:hypothetical protein